MPELVSLRLGKRTLLFDNDETQPTKLILRNLPKLTTLTSLSANERLADSFTNPTTVVLEDMPKLATVILSKEIFAIAKNLTVKNVGALEKHPAVPHQNPRTTVHIDTALQTLSSSLTQLITDNYCCNDEELTRVDFSQWALLECIEI
ncbi:hypothetical protein WA577_007265, partial [Blastocystis sp. JDR]